METVTVVEAEREIHELLVRASQGEQFLIIDGGRPVAKLCSPDEPSDPDAFEREQRAAAIKRIKELRKGQRLGADWKELVNEGRP